jgi:MFS family permease
MARVVLASFIGTSIEWYDFCLCGTAAALVFNRLFFPTLDPFAGTMASFATYAVGFFARPLGGIIFGHYGDRIGRRSMLVTTLTMMGLSTFLIGVLPTYDQIGVLAPVALAALRLVQALGVGGEWGGAVVLVVEHGHHSRRGIYASSAQARVPAGLLLANGTFAAVSALPEDQFLSWGWRAPFLAGVVLLGLGLFIRLHILETPLFAQVRAQRVTSAMPLVDLAGPGPGAHRCRGDVRPSGGVLLGTVRNERPVQRGVTGVAVGAAVRRGTGPVDRHLPTGLVRR